MGVSFVVCMYHGVLHLSDERPCTRFVVPLVGGISWRFVVCEKAMALGPSSHRMLGW